MVNNIYDTAMAMGHGEHNMPMLCDAVANFNGVELQSALKT